jgi:DNA-directed RNA polymerase subunit E'/Rpb7
MDPLFERRELVRNVHINSKFMQKNIQASLLANLRMNFEGNCSSEGYIQRESITILDYSIGRTNYVKGGVDYNVRFQADICLPHKGQVFRSTVTVKSKIGIHAETAPIKILIPRDLHIGNAEFEGIEVGQDVEFEVSGSQFKQRDKDIIVLGMLRSAMKAAPLPSLISREEETPQETVPIGTSGDEKLVTIAPAAQPEKKKRKLKKPGVVESNESNQEGVAEITN